jgi:hypothetical protein
MQNLSIPNLNKTGMVIHALVTATQEAEVIGSQFDTSLGKGSLRPYLENKLKSKRTGGVAQVVECSGH